MTILIFTVCCNKKINTFINWEQVHLASPNTAIRVTHWHQIVDEQLNRPHIHRPI